MMNSRTKETVYLLQIDYTNHNSPSFYLQIQISRPNYTVISQHSQSMLKEYNLCCLCVGTVLASAWASRAAFF